MTVLSFPTREAAEIARRRYFSILPQGYCVEIVEDRATCLGPFFLRCLQGA